jgi:hypothetical protein
MIQLSHAIGLLASKLNWKLTWRVDFTMHKNANKVYILCADSWGAFGPFFSVLSFLCLPNFIIGVNTTEDG